MLANLFNTLAEAQQAEANFKGNRYSTTGANLYREHMEARGQVAEAKRLAHVAFWRGEGKQPPRDFASNEEWLAWEQAK